MASFFIRRPIVAIVIAILTVIVGAIAIALLQSHSFRTLPRRKSGCKRTTPVPTQRLLSVCRYGRSTASDRRRQYGIHVFRKHHQWFANLSARRF